MKWLATSIKWLLAGLSACVIAWSFWHVGQRMVHGGEAARNVRVKLLQDYSGWKAGEEITVSQTIADEMAARLDRGAPIAELAGLEGTRRSVTLTILHWGNIEEEDIVVKLIERFEAEHHNIKVDHLNSSDYDTKLRTMMAAGTPPDLFYLRYEDVPEFAGLKIVRPIDSYLAAEKKAGTAEWIDDVYPIMLNGYRYDGQKQGTGRLYGLPKDFTTCVAYVNVDLFERAGVKIPYDGWTWDEYEAAMKKIAALKPEENGGPIYGGFLNTWPAVLRNIIWTFGGEYFGDNFRDVRLEDPAAQDALKMIRRVRIEDKSVYNQTGAAQNADQLFYTGKIGCIMPLGRWMTPRYRNIINFKWDVVPLPHGRRQSSALLSVGWTISAQCPHPDEAYQLMKFLCGRQGQIQMAKLGLAIPVLKSVAESDAFLDPAQLPKHSHLFLDLIPMGELGQYPPQKEFISIVDTVGSRAIQFTGGDSLTPAQAGAEIKRQWLQELDSPLQRQDFPGVRWDTIGAVAAGVAALLIAILGWRSRRQKIGALDRQQERAGWMFIMPWVIGFSVFTLGPMVMSLLLSAMKWTAMTPLHDASYVGAANYDYLMRYDPDSGHALLVTAYYVLIAVPLCQVASMIVALLMNTEVPGIRAFRTIYYVPSVISGVALCTLWLQIFNKDYGILNYALKPILGLFGAHPPDWFGDDARIFGIPAFAIMAIWQVGAGMIIYLAALKGIPTSYYEAARIDGAGPIRRFFSITLPMLSPFVFFNLIMGLIGSFQVFTQAKTMTNGGPGNATLLYVLHLYRQAFEYQKMGYASAAAWLLFVILLLITLVLVGGSKKWVYYEGLKA